MENLILRVVSFALSEKDEKVSKYATVAELMKLLMGADFEKFEGKTETQKIRVMIYNFEQRMLSLTSQEKIEVFNPFI